MKHLGILLILFLVFISCKDAASSQTETKVNVANTETKNSETTKATAEKSSAKDNSSTNNQDDWYWKNTQMSNNGAFENWEHGPVDLVMVYRFKPNESTPSKLKVGSIDSNGAINTTLPEKIQTETKLGNLQNLVFYDIQDIRKFNYTNAETGYFGKTTLSVEKNGAPIGTLTLGNSVRVTYNLTNQSTLTMGDEGYIVSWTYVDKASSMVGTEITNNTVRRDGTNTIEAENTVVYDLDFKPGWNWVKTEVIGTYELEHERGLNASWFKKHEHTVLAELPSDANYFFRKLSN